MELQFVLSGLLMEILVSVMGVHNLARCVQILGKAQLLTMTTLMDVEEDVACSGE